MQSDTLFHFAYSFVIVVSMTSFCIMQLFHKFGPFQRVYLATAKADCTICFISPVRDATKARGIEYEVAMSPLTRYIHTQAPPSNVGLTHISGSMCVHVKRITTLRSAKFLSGEHVVNASLGRYKANQKGMRYLRENKVGEYV